MNQRNLTSNEPRGEGVAEVVDSEILDVGDIAGGAEASADIVKSGAVLSAKDPVCF